MAKTCTLCKTSKDESEFIKDKGRPNSWCRVCYRSYRKQKGYDKYANRAEYFAAHQRARRKVPANKIANNVYKKQYRSTFVGTITSLLRGAKNRALNNELLFDLDREWIESRLTPMLCEATGVALTLEIDESVSHSPFRPSIDRIDNNKGYIKDNCRIVAVIYNKAKSDYTDADVLRMAQGLIDKRSQKCDCSVMVL